MPVQYTSAKATGERIGVSDETVRLWAAQRRIPGAWRDESKPGTEWHIPVDFNPMDINKRKEPTPRRQIRRTR